MKALLRTIVLSMSLVIVPFSTAQATILLHNWNDADLQASGDYVLVKTGTWSGASWFSLQWQPGMNNSNLPLGIDTVFYNSFTPVFEVWLGALGTGTNVTVDWTTNYGGVTGGGGFGDFLSQKSLDGASLAGINLPIYFLLDGVTSFPTNNNGASFDVHVRYMQNCSSWASDGRTTTVTSGSCQAAAVPEPGTLALFGVGLLGLGFIRLRRKA